MTDVKTTHQHTRYVVTYDPHAGEDLVIDTRTNNTERVFYDYDEAVAAAAELNADGAQDDPVATLDTEDAVSWHPIWCADSDCAGSFGGAYHRGRQLTYHRPSDDDLEAVNIGGRLVQFQFGDDEEPQPVGVELELRKDTPTWLSSDDLDALVVMLLQLRTRLSAAGEV